VAPDGPVLVLLEGPDGDVLVAGQFRFAGSKARSSLARYRPNGEFDESFVPPDAQPVQPVQNRHFQQADRRQS
jgi:hypothetical protein